jgi:PKD repeat protein
MKKLFYLFSLLWCCAYLSPLHAQQDSLHCNAVFNYNVNGHTVKFQPWPHLTAGTSHWWTFGDATNSSEANPTHTYANAGTYWVTHYILNQSTNCKDSFVRSVTVTDSVACTIRPEFSWRRDSTNCRKVWFINQSVPISPNVHFIWKFGDGTSSTDINPSHVYQQDGVYTVCLVMESGNNCRKEFCKQIEVRCSQPPACNFEVKFDFRRDTLNPLKVYFTNNTIVPSNAAQYLWTFGDGSSSTERNPVHTYAAPGAYKVCLKVRISNDCVRDACKEINLQPPPPNCNVQAKFVWRRDSLHWNKIWFANLSQPIPNIWRTAWSYGDGSGSQDFNSVHVYQQPGKYYVCLKVQSLNGCISTYCDSVIVRRAVNCDTVKVKFEYTRNQDKPYIISFRAIGNVPIVQQTWTIMKLSNVQVFPPPMPVLINANNPTYTFKDSGWYMVCLYAITANNCKKTYCEKIYVPHGQNGRMITGGIPVYPNPANRLVRLDVDLQAPMLLQVRVLDGRGAPKMQFVSPGRIGTNNLAIPVERLSSGMYVVEIRYGNQLKLAKFQKS